MGECVSLARCLKSLGLRDGFAAGAHERIVIVGWEWLTQIGWVGTTVVALGGLGATVWSGRRAGQVQLSIQDKQLAENRRILEWQERRAAYANFLKVFQEYFDKSVVQEQLDSLILTRADEEIADGSSVRDLMASDLDEATKEQTLKKWRIEAYEFMQEKFGVLTLREGWLLRSQVEDAANQARLIAPAVVRNAIDALLHATRKEEIQAAIKADLMIKEFEAKVLAQKVSLNELMNDDLQSDAPRAVGK